MRPLCTILRVTAPLRICVFAQRFPELSQTFVAGELHALREAGHSVRLEAGERSDPAQPGAEQGLDVHYREREGRLGRLGALLWLVARRPLASLRDLLAQRRWGSEEPVEPLRALAPAARRVARSGDLHLHAHFADGAGLTAMRLSRLLGIPYSITAHAFDIYLPANLSEKLEGAAFVTSGCDYTVRDLRGIVADRAEHVHKIIMGVDQDRFRRSEPHAGGHRVLAVGRLVEKKGFGYLIDAVAALRDRGRSLERVVIAGEGPLRGELQRQVRDLGLEGVVELTGAVDSDEVRGLMEKAAVLAVPSVVAANGDRDSMPVVAKEALAMELPVVATHEVGLPELVRPEWGRLVTPADGEALAEALDDLLALPPEQRVSMGRAGRAFVCEFCDVHRETAKLAALIAAVQAEPATPG